MTIRRSGCGGQIIHQPLSSDILLQHGTGTLTSAGAGAWEDVISITVTANGTQDIHVTAGFGVETATGAAAAYDATFRVEIDGVAGTSFARTLSGSDDKGLGAVLSYAASKTGTFIVKLQVQDDASHTVNVTAAEMHVLAR
jgi:hypothetical protein